MIRELTKEDSNIITSMPKNPMAISIKAIYEGYGFEQSFIRFYGSDDGGIVIALKNGKAYVYLEDASQIEEASTFAKLIATCVLSDIPLAYDEACLKYRGNIYNKTEFLKATLSGINNEIQPSYNLLEKVFPKAVNSTTYPVWYTDMSHMVRHNVSKIYTLQGICTVSVTINVAGTVLISHLATSTQHRGQGYATKILSHLMADQKANEMLLLSRDEASDSYYEKTGFTKIGEWYHYDWK